MKKTTMNAIINVTTAATGLVMLALSKNENYNRLSKTAKEAVKKEQQQISREKIIRKHGDHVKKEHEVAMLIGTYSDGYAMRMSYADYFMIGSAGYSLYPDESQQIHIGAIRSPQDYDFEYRNCERRIINGKLYLFITDANTPAMYDGGKENHISYERIVNSGMNPNGIVHVLDVKKLEQLGYDVFKYGASLVMDWHPKNNKEEETP